MKIVKIGIKNLDVGINSPLKLKESWNEKNTK